MYALPEREYWKVSEWKATRLERGCPKGLWVRVPCLPLDNGIKSMLTQNDVVIYVSACASRAALALAVRDTWAAFASNVYYAFDENNINLPNCIDLGILYRNQLSIKTFLIMQHMYVYHPDKKWYIKIDDDSYLFVKNAMEALSNYDHDKPWYMGDLNNAIYFCGPRDQHPIKWISGGAGIFLNNRCLRRLNKHFQNGLREMMVTYHEDCWLAAELSNLQIHPTHLPGCHQFDTVGKVDVDAKLVSIHEQNTPEKMFGIHNAYS